RPPGGEGGPVARDRVAARRPRPEGVPALRANRGCSGGVAPRRTSRRVGHDGARRRVHPSLPRPRLDGAELCDRPLGRGAGHGVFALRDALAAGLGLDPAQVTVHHAEGAGAYGHNGADDVTLDAVLLARAVPGRPVRVLWSREDEMSWAPLGPAMLARLSAG